VFVLSFTSYLLLLLTYGSCQQEGHMARECPDKPAYTGECFNCGQTG
jgi:hypothetical protein